MLFILCLHEVRDDRGRKVYDITVPHLSPNVPAFQAFTRGRERFYRTRFLSSVYMRYSSREFERCTILPYTLRGRGTRANYHAPCKRLKLRDDWEQVGNCSYSTSDANIKGTATYRSRTVSLSGNNHFCSQLLLVHIEGLRNITSLTFEMKKMCPSRNICTKHTFS